MSEILVFDLDDTLFLEKNFVLSGFCAVSDWLENTVGVNGFYAACLDIYLAGFRGNIFNMAFERLNVKYDNYLVSEAIQVYRSHKPKISLLEDARGVIDYFFKKKPLSIITDGYYDTQKNKIAALEIDNFFDFIIYSDINGKASWKPNKWSYLEIMRSYGRDDGSDFVYIADNLYKDFISAKKLGWKTIHIQRIEGEYYSAQVSEEYQADYKVNSLMELKKLIV
jgi:putative hydrolase of the HAD superfamily